MNIEEAEARNVEECLGEDLPERGHDAQIWSQSRERGEESVFLEAIGLKDRHAARKGCGLGRRIAHALLAAARPVWLRHEGHDLVAGCLQGLEGGYGERGRAEVHDPQGGWLCVWHYHRWLRRSFWILRTIRSRLMPRNRST